MCFWKTFFPKEKKSQRVVCSGKQWYMIRHIILFYKTPILIKRYYFMGQTDCRVNKFFAVYVANVAQSSKSHIIPRSPEVIPKL